MTELIKISYNKSDEPVVSGRDLHEKLGVSTRYNYWFSRMCEYGFAEEKDFYSILSKTPENLAGRPSTDHIITLDMAKQLCMIQRTDIGRRFREYFIEVEKAWSSPEKLMARALKVAERTISQLETTVAVQSQQLAEAAPKVSYYDLILNCKDLISISKIAKDYGMSAVKMNDLLRDMGIQYRQGNVWLLYQKYAAQGYTSTKTHEYIGSDGTNHAKTATYWTQKGRVFLYDMLKKHGVLPTIEREVS